MFRLVEGSVVLRDPSGNPVGLVLDDAIYRLQVETSFKEGETLDVTVNALPANPAQIINALLTETGGSPDMLVDGSVTPVDFLYAPETDQSVLLSELRIVFVSRNIEFGVDNFGAIASLANGVQITVKAQGVETELGSVQRNEDFFLLRTSETFFDRGTNDAIAFGLSFGGRVGLDDATSDWIRIRIRDDLDNANLLYFQASIWAYEEEE